MILFNGFTVKEFFALVNAHNLLYGLQVTNLLTEAIQMFQAIVVLVQTMKPRVTSSANMCDCIDQVNA